MPAKSEVARRRSRKSEHGILTASPAGRVAPLGAGTHKLGIFAERDAILVVPNGHRPSAAAPLIVALHGAGGNAHDAIQTFRHAADTHGIVILAPESRESSWDGVRKEFGPDIDFLDHALMRVFERCLVDSARVGIAGFSDGASYALSVGLANGELFTHVMALSPGFLRAPLRQGKPRIFVSHGSDDLVLPAVRCSHRIVSRLERDGYQVEFNEFPGDHRVPRQIADAAAAWFLG